MSLTNLNESPRAFARVVRPWLGLGLEAKFSGLGLEAFGLGLGLVFLALALFKAKVRVTNILPTSVSRYNYTNSTLVYQRHWYHHSASPSTVWYYSVIISK